MHKVDFILSLDIFQLLKTLIRNKLMICMCPVLRTLSYADKKNKNKNRVLPYHTLCPQADFICSILGLPTPNCLHLPQHSGSDTVRQMSQCNNPHTWLTPWSLWAIPCAITLTQNHGLALPAKQHLPHFKTVQHSHPPENQSARFVEYSQI
jgi:hypothetical protein